MKFFGNIIWLIFGGIIISLEYFISSCILIISILGIPFGLQTLKLAVLSLWPFGKEIRSNKNDYGCLSVLMNIVWLFIGGIWICLSHLFFGALLFITIIGIPFAMQHFKLAKLALTPFGKEIK
ncbi:MAG: YccF domain-containing protein [Bacteroidales bacterium]|nr:YccF domain-containing protein [Bacteroidales bacterium]